jgi:lysozyme family protein
MQKKNNLYSLLIKHIEQLKKAGLLPEKWKYHKEKVNSIKAAGANIAKDLAEFYAKADSDSQQFAAIVSDALPIVRDLNYKLSRIAQQYQYQKVPDCKGQKQIADEINYLLSQLDNILIRSRILEKPGKIKRGFFIAGVAAAAIALGASVSHVFKPNEKIPRIKESQTAEYIKTDASLQNNNLSLQLQDQKKESRQQSMRDAPVAPKTLKTDIERTERLQNTGKKAEILENKSSQSAQQGLSDSEAFKKALELALKLEGGFSDDIHDPGGMTNHGITQKTYNYYRKSWGFAPQTVRNITEQEITRIYYNYWIDAKCNKINSDAIRIAHFSAAINIGPMHAARCLQRALSENIYRLKDDGQIGPITLGTLDKALAESKERKILDSYLDWQLRRYEEVIESNSTLKKYKKGWKNRVRWTREFSERYLRSNKDKK